MRRTIAQIAREEAGKLAIPQHEGVYAGLLGPSYETPAEIEYLRRIGADLVGMSTVAEVIAARHMGIKVLAISCVTNMAAGILDQPLSHAEVMETGERVKTTFESLLRAVLPRIAQDVTRKLTGCPTLLAHVCERVGTSDLSLTDLSTPSTHARLPA